MKLLITLTLLTQLTGCAAMFEAAAASQNAQDPCQRPLAEQPDFCGRAKARARYRITDNHGHTVGWIK